MTLILALKQSADAIDPKLWYLGIALLTAGIIALWRQLHPKSFDALPPRIKALPAMLIGAVLSATAATDLKSVFVNAFTGVLAGLLAVGGYEAKVRLLSGSGSRPEPVEPTEKQPDAEPEPTEQDQKDQGDGS